MAPQDASLMSALRQSTRDRHDTVETLLALDGTLPLSRYIEILRGFHGFLSVWEPRVRCSLPASLHVWFDARRRAHLVRDDLDHFGVDPVAGTPCRAMRAAASVRLDTTAHALGSLYVIEGSALGGQVIAPRLQASLGLGPTTGARYFHGHGDRTGGLWKDFRETATCRVGALPADISKACEAACATFDALAASFTASVTPHPEPA